MYLGIKSLHTSLTSLKGIILGWTTLYHCVTQEAEAKGTAVIGAAGGGSDSG
jgi:hypothetical protein